MPIYPGRRPGTHRVTIYTQGKQREWTVEGTKRDAKRFEEDKRLELRTRNAAAARRELTFYEFSMERYRPHAIQHLGARTWAVSRKYQVADLCEHLGALRLSQVGGAIETMKQNLRRKRGDGPLAPKTVNLLLTALKTMLRLAVKWKLLDVMPEVAMLPKPPKPRPRFWTLDEVRRVYRAARQEWPSFLPLMHFLLETGCRRGEAVVCEWSWIDWDAALLRIPVTAVWHPKGKRERDVPLTPELLAALRALPKPHEGRIFRKDRGNRGAPYNQWPRKLWELVMQSADLVGATPHITRHTYASHFLASVPDLGVLAEVLGHSEQRTTELYAHMLPERLARARGAVRLAPAGTMAPTLATARQASK